MTPINEHFGNKYSDVDTHINRTEDKKVLVRALQTVHTSMKIVI